MRGLALAGALVVAVSQPLPTNAEERTYQAVMHVHESHAMPVLGSSDHVVGTGAFRGIAIFTDGEVAVHRYDGWFDLKDGSGPFHGYALWQFEDGSELRAAYDGMARNAAVDRVDVEARFRDFSGTGRFADVKGEGAFSGRRMEPIDQGGTTYLSGTLDLAPPE